MGLAMSLLIAVSTTYSLIQFRDQLHPVQMSFFIFVLVVSLAVSGAISGQAIALRCQSAALIQSCTRTASGSGRVREIDARFYKSCRPIKLWVGKFFPFSSNDFLLKFYGKGVLESVMNLLLAF